MKDVVQINFGSLLRSDDEFKQTTWAVGRDGSIVHRHTVSFLHEVVENKSPLELHTMAMKDAIEHIYKFLLSDDNDENSETNYKCVNLTVNDTDNYELPRHAINQLIVAVKKAINSNGRNITPPGENSDLVLAVDKEHVRKEFYSGRHSADRPEARRRAFHRAMLSATQNGIVRSTGSATRIEMVWLVEA